MISKTEISTNLELIPLLKSLRVRKDNDGYSIIINWEKSIWFVVSEAFLQILYCCNGEDSIGDVIDKYSDNYSNVEYEILKRDVVSVISISYELGFILFKD